MYKRNDWVTCEWTLLTSTKPFLQLYTSKIILIVYKKKTKGAVCNLLTLLKHINYIICLQIFRKHAKFSGKQCYSLLFYIKMCVQCLNGLFLFSSVWLCPLPIYPIVIRHPGSPVDRKQSILQPLKPPNELGQRSLILPRAHSKWDFWAKWILNAASKRPKNSWIIFVIFDTITLVWLDRSVRHSISC